MSAALVLNNEKQNWSMKNEIGLELRRVKLFKEKKKTILLLLSQSNLPSRLVK